jgi:hypothetical protein
MQQKWWFFVLGISMMGLAAPVSAQVRVSATPVPAIIPTLTQPPTALAIATFTPTWTATTEPGIVLEVRADVGGEINVRNMPDTNSDRLGAIKPGERYPITARYFRWLRFDFDGKSGWVFDELVTVIGDPSTIPDIDPFLTPTAAGAVAAAVSGEDLQATLAVITLTPGAEETFSAEQRVIMLPTEDSAEIVSNAAPRTPLPTFTPPSGEVTGNQPQMTTSDAAAIAQAEGIDGFIQRIMAGNIPPIVPIVLLALGGLLGLFISLLRR